MCVKKAKENQRKATANFVGHNKSNVKQDFGFVDNRPETTKQIRLQNKTVQLNRLKTRNQEKQEFEAKITMEISRMTNEKANLTNAIRNEQNKRYRQRVIDRYSRRIGTIDKKLLELNEQKKLQKYTDVARDKVAAEWFDKAKLKDKNKLYIGNAYQIEEHLKKKEISGKREKAEKRVLNAPDDLWTEGVNEAWMRGGEEGKAIFKLVTQLPEDLKNKLDNITGADFLNLVKNDYGNNRVLWNKRNRRHTYLSKEIAHLLDNGYKFEEVAKKSGTGKKQRFLKN